MCGIVGIARYRSDLEEEIQTRALKIIFSDLLIRTETRGEDATGVYQVHTDGDWLLMKKGEKASTWLYESSSKFTYPMLTDQWGRHPHPMSYLVGHCRKATKGSGGSNNDDNHPFSVPLDERNAILGIHNGTLENHNKIYQNLEKVLERKVDRKGDVDSEAIFHLLKYATEGGTKPFTEEALKYVGERLQGSYACLTVNSRYPSQMAVFRYQRPIDLAIIRPFNWLVMVSERRFLEGCVDHYRFIRSWAGVDLPPIAVSYASLPERDYLLIDTEKEFPEKGVAFEIVKEICRSGPMTKYQQPIASGWGEEVKRYSYYGASYYSTYNHPATVAGSQRSSAISEEDLSLKEASESLDKLDAESSAEFIKFRKLGVLPSMTTIKEVEAFLGLRPKEYNTSDKLELLAKAFRRGFSAGYALEAYEKERIEKEFERVQVKLHNKKAKAQARIWEYGVILTILKGMLQAGQEVSLESFRKVLWEGTSYNDERKEKIFNTFRSALENKNNAKAAARIANLLSADQSE